jgi:anthranilate 1,2-dioxygenase large subunit/terephthalate 1,2-dioxygenase oxygenase component alpha subunit
VVQQIHNCLAVRQIVPAGVNSTALYLLRLCRRLARDEPAPAETAEPGGSAGFVSMEDGCVTGFVQRGIASAGDKVSVVEMGG